MAIYESDEGILRAKFSHNVFHKLYENTTNHG